MRFNRIHQGDCLNLIERLDNESIDLVVMDPPYGIRYCNTIRNKRKNRPVIAGDTPTESIELLSKTVHALARVVKPGATIYMFGPGGRLAFKQGSKLVQILETEFTIRQTIIWDKTYKGLGHYWRAQYETIVMASHGRVETWLGGHKRANVLHYKKDKRMIGGHPTPKPLDLIKELIECSSAPGDLVLDPFVGSGTTCLAALELGRQYLGFELDANYVQVARKRIAQAKKAL